MAATRSVDSGSEPDEISAADHRAGSAASRGAGDFVQWFKGRIDYNEFSGGGFKNDELRLTRSFVKSEVITDFGPQREGGHGGADASLQDMIFRGLPKDDPLGLRADLRAGALSSLIGIAARRSIERGGQTVKIGDLVKFYRRAKWQFRGENFASIWSPEEDCSLWPTH